MVDVYRADHLGSLLRPDEIKEARRAFHNGDIEREQLMEAEDKAILRVLERQQQIGPHGLERWRVSALEFPE